MTTSTGTDRQFRAAMGRFATGVTIISTASDGEVHGMTANGFMSVSLDPQLVLISVGKHTRMHELLQTSRAYGVSILSSEHQSLSDHFAGRPVADAGITFREACGVPVIADALMSVSTEVVDVREAGDHTLFVGRVREFTERAGDPLIFHSGTYRELRSDLEFSAPWSESEHVWF